MLVDSLSSSGRKPLAPEVARLRAIKSEAEQEVMRAAADISGRSHAKVSRYVTSWITLRTLHVGDRPCALLVPVYRRGNWLHTLSTFARFQVRNG